MSGSISAVPVSELTSGVQLFRCIPYSCTMLARACVTRQAQADSDFPPVSLLLCKGCELGAQVAARVTDVVVDPHAAARASRKHIKGLPQNPGRRALPVLAPVPIESLPVQPVRVAPAQTNEGNMPKTLDLTGKEMAGVKVLSQLGSGEKGTVWRVRFPCKHEEDVIGSVLTSYEKNGYTRHCKECRGEAKSDAKGKPTRSKAAPEAPVTPARKPLRKPPSPPLVVVAASALTHEFPLRRDFTASLSLPSDLSKSDVQRLSRWLDVLVFDEAIEA